MSAAAFARLSPAEQRALLVRVFQRRLEHSRDLYYETEQIWRSYENYNNQDREASRGYEEAGRMLGQLPSNRVKCRHWRLGDSFRMDEEGYDKPSNVQWSSRSSEGVNAEEGIGRIADVSKDPKSPPSAQVVYPFDPLDNNRYILWLDGKHSLDLLYGQPRRDDYLFHHLVDHQAQFEITPLPDRDKVRLAFDWKPSWATRRRRQAGLSAGSPKGVPSGRVRLAHTTIRPQCLRGSCGESRSSSSKRAGWSAMSGCPPS